MKIKLTTHQLTYLGFDGPQTCPLVCGIITKTRSGEQDLTPGEYQRLRREIRSLPTFGSSPSTHRVARLLQDKLYNLEE